MVLVTVKGDWGKTRRFLEKNKKINTQKILEKYGREGVEALAASTPKDTGETANSWSYEIKSDRNGAAIYWSNSNVNKGVPIAVILRYGHATGNGGFVKGRDFISPAIRPVFDKLADSVWKEVTE